MEQAHRPAAQPPLERIVFSSERAAVGEWRCAVTQPNFRDTGPTRKFLVAFPRTSVRIRNAGRAAFVADATLFTIYNAGQRYTREAVHPDGDACDWWSVDADTARSIARAVDAQAPHDTDHPFRFERGPANAALYLEQRKTLDVVKAGVVDALEIEERALRIVERALAAAASAVEPVAAPRGLAQRDLAEAALALLGARFRDRLTLGDLAARLDVSAFHLCRVFRRHTGGLMHRHVTRLRLRAALHAIAEARGDLSAVALEAGFCSHSHFTSAFVREFGIAPSAWRSAGGHQRAAFRRV